MSSRTGRPPVDNPRKHVRSVHLTADELATIERAAGTTGKAVTVYIREKALAAARRQR